MVHRLSDGPQPCRGCDRGWIWLRPGSVPTVMPCWQHRPVLHVLWEAGAFQPEVPDWWWDAA